jgi:hypothetical protein
MPETVNRIVEIALVALALSACDPGVFRASQAWPVDTDASVAVQTPAAAGDSGQSAPEKAGASAGLAGVGGAVGVGAAGGAGAVAGCPQADDVTAVRIRSSELGALTTPNPAGWLAGGLAERVQDRVLWLFYESDVGPPVAAWSNPQDILQMPPQLGDVPLIKPIFSNVGDADNPFIPTSAWLHDAREVRFFYSNYPGIYPVALGVASISVAAPGATILKAPGEVFAADPAADGGVASDWLPVAFAGAFQQDGFVYAYACQARPDAADEQQGATHQQPCRAARVQTERVLEGDQYTFWNGQAWVGDFSRAIVVLDHMPSGLSVAYNAYLGKYLATHSGVDNDVVLQWADSPAGPFERLGSIGTLKATAGFGLTYSALEHVTLRESCDRVLYVSYVLPLRDSDDAGVRKETHLLRVELE